ncbi:MAG: twin-arginine translocase TatA/TatE family subunit [Actinomycetota bacterium]
MGLPEWGIVLVVAVLLFGAKKLPELARSLGRSTSEFKQGVREGSETATTPPAAAPTEGSGEAPKQS